MCDCKREWRSIETAPTGVPLLCAIPHGDVFVLLKNIRGEFVHWPCSWNYQFQEPNICKRATHWMGLPAPPTDAREASPAIDVAQTPQTPASEARNRPSGDCDGEGTG